jgi:hypothetical protein
VTRIALQMVLSVPARVPNPSLTSREIFPAWGRILTGHVPLLSIEVIRECPKSVARVLRVSGNRIQAVR